VRCGFCEYYLHNLPNLSPLPADNTKRFEGGKVPSPFCTGGVAVSEDRNTIVTVDGEVYNHADLAGSIRGLNDSKDPTNLPELILQLYEAQGIDFVDKLDGGFALAIWEEHDGKLLLARDRFGQTPLFHTERPGGITFCSDLRALLGDVGFERILDHSALYDYLSFNYVPAPGTLFEGLRILSPGCVLSVTDSAVSCRRYWKPGEQIDYEDKDSVLAERFLALLEKGLQRRMDDLAGPAGIFLSGGIDSSALTMMMADRGEARLKAFCAGFEEAAYDSTEQATRVARRFGVECSRVEVPADSCALLPEIISLSPDLCANTSIVPMYLMCRQARQEAGVDIVFTGSGADETLGGLETYKADIVAYYYTKVVPRHVRDAFSFLADRVKVSDWPVGKGFRMRLFLNGARHEPIRAHYFWRMVFSEDEKKKLYSRELHHLLQRDSFAVYEPHLKGINRMSDFNKFIHADLAVLSPDFFVSTFRTGGRAMGMTMRSPFFDIAVSDFAVKLPFKYKVRHLETKYLWKKALRGRLPNEIIHQKKKGLSVPVGNWIRRDPQGIVSDFLSVTNMKKLGLFHTGYVEDLLRQHRDGAEHQTFKVWSLLNFAVWHRQFMEG